MSIKRYSDRSNDKTVMKGGGRDVAVGNPGMGFNTDVPQQLSLASPQRGSSIVSVTQGSDNANVTAAPVLADAVVSAGQSVGIDFSGTTGSAANLTVTLTFRRVIAPTRQYLSTTTDES
jgi:hypothetical protein